MYIADIVGLPEFVQLSIMFAIKIGFPEHIIGYYFRVKKERSQSRR